MYDVHEMGSAAISKSPDPRYGVIAILGEALALQYLYNAFLAISDLKS